MLDECKNDGQAAMPDLWCENHLSFRDVPKILPKDVTDPDGSDSRIVKMLKKIQPSPPLDPRKTVAAEVIKSKLTGVTDISSLGTNLSAHAIINSIAGHHGGEAASTGIMHFPTHPSGPQFGLEVYS